MSLAAILRDHATSIINTQIPAENRIKILAYCRSADADEESWDGIKNLIVDGKNGLKTCRLVDICALHGCTGVPDPMFVARAIKFQLVEIQSLQKTLDEVRGGVLQIRRDILDFMVEK